MTDLLAQISDAVDRRRDELVELLIELVRMPTEAPPGDSYVGIVERLGAEAQRVGFAAERVDMPQATFEERCRVYHPELHGPRANLVARRAVDGKPGMVFYTHVDTVPAGERADWSFDPFDAFERDGYVYGRGSGDSKAGLVALIGAFAALQELGVPLAVSPLLALTSDEEIGPYTGLMYLADAGVFDGYERFHSVDGMAENVAIGRLGAFTWSIAIAGRSVHSGRSILGLNPIEHSVALLEELVALGAEVDTRRSALDTGPEYVAATGRTKLSPSLNVTIARGGVKHNVVPPRFMLEGDRRYLPEEDPDACIAELRAAIDRARERDPRLDCELTVHPSYVSHAGDASDPWVEHVRQVVSAVRDADVPVGAASGSSDTAHVGRTTDMVLTHHGPGRSDSNAHGVDERIAVDDMLAVAKIAAALAAGAGGTR